MTRREARELIMKMLYEMTFHPEKDANLLLEGYTQDMKGKVKDFIVNEFNGVLQHQEEIDSIIEASSTNWSINRIAKVDHMLLRMAVYELKWGEDIPQKVAINEAIEIAKVYSTDKSPKFINGILGNMRNQLRSKNETKSCSCIRD